MAVLLRAPQTYLSVLEHALDRAGIPAWFHRGTRRPDPAGRALLALLACADEELSARRFAEYVSLGQVPLNEAGNADQWSPPADDIVEAVLPPDERAEDAQPEDEAAAQIARGESDRDLAGTLARALALGGSDRRSRGDRPSRSLAAPPQGPGARIRSARSRSELRRSGSIARARARARSRAAARACAPSPNRSSRRWRSGRKRSRGATGSARSSGSRRGSLPNRNACSACCASLRRCRRSGR